MPGGSIALCGVPRLRFSAKVGDSAVMRGDTGVSRPVAEELAVSCDLELNARWRGCSTSAPGTTSPDGLIVDRLRSGTLTIRARIGIGLWWRGDS